MVPDLDSIGKISGRVVRKTPGGIKTVRSEVQNEPVLSTLRRLTGEDFGYTKAAWLQWWQEKGQALAEAQQRKRQPFRQKPMPEGPIKKAQDGKRQKAEKNKPGI